MKTTLLSILTACLLAGCYQRINSADLSRATAICKGVKRIEHIDAAFGGRENVKCIGSPSTAIDETVAYE